MRVVGNYLAPACNLSNRSTLKKCGIAATTAGASITVFLLHVALNANGGKFHKIELKDYGFLTIPAILTLFGIACLVLSTEKVGKCVDRYAQKTNEDIDNLIETHWGDNPNYVINHALVDEEPDNRGAVIRMSNIQEEGTNV